MRCLDKGHLYEVGALDGGSAQVLRFVKREGSLYPGNTGHYGGTIMQEVLRVLANRSRYVNAQIPCWETWLATYLLRFCIWLFERRAARRHGRRVPTLRAAEFGWTCRACLHVGCNLECAPAKPGGGNG